MPSSNTIVGNSEYTPFLTLLGMASTKTLEVRTPDNWRKIAATKKTIIIRLTGMTESIGTLNIRMSVPGIRISTMGEPSGGTGNMNMINANIQKKTAPADWRKRKRGIHFLGSYFLAHTPDLSA